WCVIVGESELQANTVVLKNLKTTEQTTVPRAEIIEKLRAARVDATQGV
ncbi:MAG: Anticodon binding domain, partial [Phycisphaerales bacterium]|nr:Anticodon binding domain [Phycisphaerales bacterium]